MNSKNNYNHEPRKKSQSKQTAKRKKKNLLIAKHQRRRLLRPLKNAARAQFTGLPNKLDDFFEQNARNGGAKKCV